ncbi:hypothetical protein TrVE_jg1338 [Triparma verrucosa]|uniref:Uncharacterized protein n=1 Tax=Triparma verrucosa TaxID=1606542 RepID=A0A9W7FI89_9STRA|nr:hypothetical protein TrVE_jg1338 [Triparma verrucosa]
MGISHTAQAEMKKRKYCEGSELDSTTDETPAYGIEVLDPSYLEGTDDTPAVGGDDFMHTDDFRRLFIEFVTVDTLVAMRWLDRNWHKVVEKKLTELENEPYGEMIIVGGNDVSYDEAWTNARQESMKQVFLVVFLLNITKVGKYACAFASILVVDIPEGITTTMILLFMSALV